MASTLMAPGCGHGLFRAGHVHTLPPPRSPARSLCPSRSQRDASAHRARAPKSATWDVVPNATIWNAMLPNSSLLDAFGLRGRQPPPAAQALPFAAQLLPGSAVVLDRLADRLVPCTARPGDAGPVCPMARSEPALQPPPGGTQSNGGGAPPLRPTVATQLVNRAPFSFLAWVAMDICGEPVCRRAGGPAERSRPLLPDPLSAAGTVRAPADTCSMPGSEMYKSISSEWLLEHPSRLRVLAAGAAAALTSPSFPNPVPSRPCADFGVSLSSNAGNIPTAPSFFNDSEHMRCVVDVLDNPRRFLTSSHGGPFAGDSILRRALAAWQAATRSSTHPQWSALDALQQVAQQAPQTAPLRFMAAMDSLPRDLLLQLLPTFLQASLWLVRAGPAACGPRVPLQLTMTPPRACLRKRRRACIPTPRPPWRRPWWRSSTQSWRSWQVSRGCRPAIPSPSCCWVPCWPMPCAVSRCPVQGRWRRAGTWAPPSTWHPHASPWSWSRGRHLGHSRHSTSSPSTTRPQRRQTTTAGSAMTPR